MMSTIGRFSVALALTGVVAGAGVASAQVNAQGYAYVKPDGTLWTSMTRNVTTAASHPRTGLYCLPLPFRASAAVATLDAGSLGYPSVVSAFLPGGPRGGVSLSGCPAGFSGVSVNIQRAANGAPIDAAFWIVLY